MPGSSGLSARWAGSRGHDEICPPYSSRVVRPACKGIAHGPLQVIAWKAHSMQGHHTLHCKVCSRRVSQAGGCKHQMKSGEESCTTHWGAPAAEQPVLNKDEMAMGASRCSILA